MKMTARVGLVGLSALWLTVALGCGHSPVPQAAGAAGLSARSEQGLAASVLGAEAVPATLRNAVLPLMQRAADDMSRRRKLDFFALHGNPVGLRLQLGDRTAHVLSLLGTSKQRTSLNIEMRALVGAAGVGSTANYSGPVTLTAEAVAVRRAPGKRNDQGITFELLTGALPSHVERAYGTAMDRLARHLERRYDARALELGGDVTPFTLRTGGAPVGYVLCDQRNMLVLGDRKYADVQTVMALGLDGSLLAGYSLVGFNEKTTGAEAAPAYRAHHDAPVGPIFEFGDYEGRH